MKYKPASNPSTPTTSTPNLNLPHASSVPNLHYIPPNQHAVEFKNLTPPPPSTPTDTLHDLMNRRKEAEKNKLRFHLTEADCQLICTNAVDRVFQDGAIIAESSHTIKSVFRLKAGRISFMKAGVQLFELHAVHTLFFSHLVFAVWNSHFFFFLLIKGHFVGEGLFIRNDAPDIFGANLVAKGLVMISEVNLPFVKQLLLTDNVSHFTLFYY